MSKPIQQLIDELPSSNMTVSALQSLDFIAPDEWQNTVGFANTIQFVTGESDEDLIKQIEERAIYLYNDRSQGYQRALWLYQSIDGTDKILAANKSEKEHSIDFCLKLVAELVAFCHINGIGHDSIGEFVSTLEEYRREALIRMVALVSFDGLIPLGSNFVNRVSSLLTKITPLDLAQNSTFQLIKDVIPGHDSLRKLNFISETFNSVKDWMSNLIGSHGLSRENVVSSLQSSINFTNNELDNLGTHLDVSTNYYEHTGTQTIAVKLIERAVSEI